MTNSPDFRRHQGFKRIGIICAGLDEIKFPALKFLVLQLNTLQQTFEYEFVPFDDDDALISTIAGGSELDRESIRREIPALLIVMNGSSRSKFLHIISKKSHRHILF